MDEAERLLPTLIAAGYAEADEVAWGFTQEGQARAHKRWRSRLGYRERIALRISGFIGTHLPSLLRLYSLPLLRELSLGDDTWLERRTDALDADLKKELGIQTAPPPTRL
jgi:hypothetical protein